MKSPLGTHQKNYDHHLPNCLKEGYILLASKKDGFQLFSYTQYSDCIQHLKLLVSFPQNPRDMSSLKSNGWNVKSHPIEMENHLIQISIFGFKMLIFQGVSTTNLPSCHAANARYTEKHLMVRSVTCGPLASSCSRSAEKTLFLGERKCSHYASRYGTFTYMNGWFLW